MIIVSFGGGTNSTALLVGMKARGITPDAILFADTGSEKPHTYNNVELISRWCKSIGFPEITTVRVTGELLFENCIRRKALPAIAYGFKTCSQRWKIEPQDKWMNNWDDAKKVWARGEKIVKYIGFDADEPWREKDYEDKKYVVEYPLIQWGWGRERCVQAIKEEGLPLPGKSACYFCPNSKPSEVERLKQEYPELHMRAIEMEANADLTAVKGLGRTWAWSDLEKQESMFDFAPEMPCGCFS